MGPRNALAGYASHRLTTYLSSFSYPYISTAGARMKPKQIWNRVCRLAARTWAAFPVGANKQCCLCGRKVRRFLPYRDSWSGMPAVLKELSVVGSDIENFECPACGCHDRERHLLLYLRASGLLEMMSGSAILHLAPERHLQRIVAAANPRQYVLGDLYPAQVDVRRVDLQDIDFPEASFDFVIANHVLEHVNDDAKALREILRVLRPGGRAILQTPYASRLQTKLEDSRLHTEAQRLQAYGQEDHQRLYGADFADFVVSFGFVQQLSTHASLLAHMDPVRMGVNAHEPFLLFSKPELS